MVESSGSQGRLKTLSNDDITNLTARFKSKRDIYDYLSTHGKNASHSLLFNFDTGQIYLPPFTKATLAFMGGILRGEKRCFSNQELRPRVVPHSKLLTVEHIIMELQGDRELL